MNKGNSENSMHEELQNTLSQIVSISIPSVQRLCDEELFAAAGTLLNQVPGVKEQVRERKKVLMDHEWRTRRYISMAKSDGMNSSLDQCNYGLDNIENVPSMRTKSILKFKSKRTETEALEELAHRKAKMEESDDRVRAASKCLFNYFSFVNDKLKNGSLLECPISAIISGHKHIISKFSGCLEAVEPKLAHIDNFLKTLERYDRIQTLNDTLIVKSETVQAQATRSRTPVKGLVFGKDHKVANSPFLEYCVEYLTLHGLATEGIFRVSGNKVMVSDLVGILDKGEDINFDKVGVVFKLPV